MDPEPAPAQKAGYNLTLFAAGGSRWRYIFAASLAFLLSEASPSTQGAMASLQSPPSSVSLATVEQLFVASRLIHQRRR